MIRSHVPPTPAKRVAFVLGNSRYQSVARLAGPEVDRKRVVGSLEGLGFEPGSIFGGLDLPLEPNGTDRPTLSAEFDRFLAAVAGADMALFYYSGHGLQTTNGNFIVPVDYRINRAGPETGLLPIKPWIVKIQQALEVSKAASQRRTCLVFLDACRDNPWVARGHGTRGLSDSTQQAPNSASDAFRPGLADMDIDGEGVETFIAFATSPGTWAIDGSPSPFTKAVCRYSFVRGGVSIDDVMRWVAQAVRGDTKNRQRPWNHDNLTTGWSFVSRNPTPARMMSMLGFLAGAIAGLLVFNNDAHLFALIAGNWAERSRHLGAGLLFGSVIGYGVFEWRRPVWWAPLVACVGTAGAYLVAMSLVQLVAVGYEQPPTPADVGRLRKDPEFAILLNAIVVSSLIFALGTVLSGAVSTRALRRPSAIVFALMASLSVTAIYVLIEGAKVHFGGAPDTKDMSPIARALVLWLVIPIASGLWFGTVAFCVGYSITSYAPRTRDEADRDLEERAGR